MYVVGLTGPLGSGKSAVLHKLRGLGAQTLRADDASRELLAKDERLLSEVREQLGAQLFREDGTLDRRATAALIFADADARRRLEKITHGPMVQWLREQLDALRRIPDPPTIAVLEAAILTHMGARPLADCVVRVWAPREECLRRICARDGVSEAEAEKRLALQDGMGLFDEPADHVLDTSGSPEDTSRRVEELWSVLLAEAGCPGHQ